MKLKNIVTSFLLFSSAIIVAQEPSMIIKVWPDKVPGAIADTSVKELTIIDSYKIKYCSNITDPTMLVFFPPADKANGTAVIICPGGAYARLAMNHEGYQIAEWFNTIGVTAIILKYRLPNDKIMVDKTIGPLQDAQEAIRIVRRHSAEWKINPDKIGIMGFSAGGNLASTASTHFNDSVYYQTDKTSARPDFSILVYPVISMDSSVTHMGSRENLIGKNPSRDMVKKFSNDLQVTSQTPPAFIVHSSDDKAVSVQNSLRYFEALNKAGVPAELHIYKSGGHGYGLGRNVTSESTWPEALKNWLRDNNLRED